MFAIIRPHRIDFSGMQHFPALSWNELLGEIGAARAPGGVGNDQRVLVAGDEAFVFVWAATTSQLKEILRRHGITAYTEDEARFRGESKEEYNLLRKSTRHQCHMYDGGALVGIRKMAPPMIRSLGEGRRCLYFNSPELVAEMTNCLEASGLDVDAEVSNGSLLLSSDQSHLAGGQFEIDRMLDSLETAVEDASDDGYGGLWAVGDMAWEFGPVENFAKLLTYERRLEELFRRQPTLSGVCQYHVATLPREALHHGLISHSSIFVNESLTRVNPTYLRAPRTETRIADNIKLDEFIAELCSIDNGSRR
jgi:hypothetical protein